MSNRDYALCHRDATIKPPANVPPRGLLITGKRCTIFRVLCLERAGLVLDHPRPSAARRACSRGGGRSLSCF